MKSKLEKEYQNLVHCPAQTEGDVIKLMVDAVENKNRKPICDVRCVGRSSRHYLCYDVPGIVARDRQQTLAIRWILDFQTTYKLQDKLREMFIC